MGTRDDIDLLHELDRYFDAVPRAATTTEEIGPFTLFINSGNGWRYYARPRPGEIAFSVADVHAVIARQRETSQPRQFEWIANATRAVAPAAIGAGLHVEDRPLLWLDPGRFRPLDPPRGVEIRLVEPDEDLARFMAIADVGFAAPGTAVGEQGVEALAEASEATDPGTIAFAKGFLTAGRSRLAVAFVEGAPVASGSHQPVGTVTEITGVACLPAFRRRGVGAAVTSALVRDALERGVDSVCLSAGDDTIARVYARVGFQEIGRVGEARQPE
jgi:ribosomal protein S18 acetylase RimI-like enzyme